MKLRHSKSAQRLLSTLQSGVPQGILLTGPIGVGLGTLARHIAVTHGVIAAVVQPESASTAVPTISVDRIRELYNETRTNLGSNRFIIIDDADAMNVTAQNALLKLLEEPNESIRFILTSHAPDSLLPTIRSRVQTTVIGRIGQLETKRLTTSLGVTDPQQLQRLLYVADGLPAELHRLVADEAAFRRLSERVSLARDIIIRSPYERLVVAHSFAGSRSEAIDLIAMAVLLLRRSLTQQADRSTLTRIDRFIAASHAIRANGNVRLHLANAVL